MEDSQDSFGRPNIRTDPRTGTAVYWNTQPSGNGMDPMAEWTNAPYGMVPSNDHSGRCQLHMSRHDQEHCFDGALPASDYYVPISQQEINDHGRGSLNPHAAQSEQFQDLSHELFEQSTHSSRYLMDHDAPLGDTFARPTTVPEEACGAEAVGSLGFDQAHHHNVHQLSALDMLDATGQAVFSSTADLREFPMSNSDSYWMNNGPRPAIPSGNNPWSQFTNRGIRPYPLLVNRSHVGYEQLSAQILGEANAPSVGSVSRRYKTDRNQRLELSHNSAEGISFSQSMPASPGPGRFVGRDLADHSSPEEARSPDTGSQEIVFDQHSGDPVSVKGKRIVPEDQRAESQWIRKNGGPCDRCRRGKRKCRPSHIEGRSPTTQASYPSAVSDEASSWVVIEPQTPPSTKRARESVYAPSLPAPTAALFPRDVWPRPTDSSSSATISDAGPAAKRPRTRAGAQFASPGSASNAAQRVPECSTVPRAPSRESSEVGLVDPLQKKASFSEAKPGLGAQFMTGQ